MTQKYIFLIYLVICMGFASCHDSGPEFENTVTALRNSIPWSGTVQVQFYQSHNDTLVSVRTNVRNSITNREDYLSFHFVPVKAGTYTVYPHVYPSNPTYINSLFAEIQGGDVIYQTFDLDTTHINSLTVESYDPYLKKIIISFETSWINQPNQNIPETKFTLSEGKIVAIIEE